MSILQNRKVASPGEFLTGKFNFFLVRTTLNIKPNGDPTHSAQRRFNFLQRTISLRAQPIIFGDVVSANYSSVQPDLPVTSGMSTPFPVYSFIFAIEHNKAWDNVDIQLAEYLNGHHDFVYTVPSDNNNVSVTKSDTLDLDILP